MRTAEKIEDVEMDELELIEKMLAHRGTILLRNGFGTMELRGQDLTIKTTEGWLTIYHAGAPHSEHRSHLHLKRGRLKYARVLEKEKGTPQLAFYEAEGDAPPGTATGETATAAGPHAKPPFSMFFAPFFDWQAAKGPEPIPENQRRFHEWVATNGRSFRIISPAVETGP